MGVLSTLILAAEEGAAAAEEEGGSFLVEPGVGLMIWTLLVFGVSMAILYKLAFPRIAEALDKRQRLIEDSIDSANRTKAEASELLEEYRTRLKDARSQADEIVTRARKAGEETEREAVEAARVKREELLEQARRDIEVQVRLARRELTEHAADLAVQLAGDRIARETTPADHARLVGRYLEQVKR